MGTNRLRTPIFQHLIEKISGFFTIKRSVFYYKKSIFRAFGFKTEDILKKYGVSRTCVLTLLTVAGAAKCLKDLIQPSKLAVILKFYSQKTQSE